MALALSGGVGCVLAYGQTSSGKTYTMEGIESCISRDLFDTARAIGKRLAPDVPENEDLFEFTVTFLELLGKRSTDLVDHSGAEVPIQEDKVRFLLGNHFCFVGSTQNRLATSDQG